MIASKVIPSSSPTTMPTSTGSFLFGQLMGEQLKARDLQYTAHYIEKFMGHRQDCWWMPGPGCIATTS